MSNAQTKIEPIMVSSLVCHRDVPMTITCLGSLLKYSQENIKFILHDDGSLQDEDKQLLSASLSSPTIISKDESDEQMEDILAHYPASLQFRKQDVLAKKLLDCIHFNPSETFSYCDTDILFTRPFRGLFDFPNTETQALMMYDLTNSYCMRSWQMLKYNQLQVPQHPNSGLLYYRQSCYDLDFIEWFLSKQELRRIPYFVEQTGWALLSWRASCQFWNPKQIVFVTPSLKLDKQFVAGHFVKTHRNLLKPYIDNPIIVDGEEVVQIQTVPAKVCTPTQYFCTEFMRPLARAAQRLKR